MENTLDFMKSLVSLCSRRGFIFRSSDIYGGVNGFWDYGPLGIALKNNIRDSWWNSMTRDVHFDEKSNIIKIVGIDTATILHTNTWEASGHLSKFSDTMVDCKETKNRYRCDHLISYRKYEDMCFVFHKDATLKEMEKRLSKFGKKEKISNDYFSDFASIDPSDYSHVIGPDATVSGTLTEPKEFNLMFETKVGATSDQKSYLRPETAQGIFLNFKNIVDSSRVKIPFGIAQIGKAYRNEVTPKNFIFRTREFEQMELEFFCHPSEAKKWHDYWVKKRKDWWLSLGVKENSLMLRQQSNEELAHYAKNGCGTVDIEYQFPFTFPDFGEIEGVAHRSDFDLKAHEKLSGQNLSYYDLVTKETFHPHVIEPSAGLTRAVLAVLCSCYREDDSRPSKMYFDFPTHIAPKLAAILPLIEKSEQSEISSKIYSDLSRFFSIDIDTTQSIGKRYARQDEIGTPFCITIDTKTKEDQTVTVRHRNTMHQERISIDSLKYFLMNSLD